MSRNIRMFDFTHTHNQKAVDVPVVDYGKAYGRTGDPSSQECTLDLVDLEYEPFDEVLHNFIAPHIKNFRTLQKLPIAAPEDVAVLSKKASAKAVTSILSTRSFHNVPRINKVFEAVNDVLPDGGMFIGSGRTTGIIRQTTLKKYPKVMSTLLLSYLYLFHRVCAKLSITRKLYFRITKGKNRIVSRAEVLGRLISCGFEIIDEATIDERLYFIARKVNKPEFNMCPTYGAFIRLKRVGKDGKFFTVYKFRTMHPYSEYLQVYVHSQNGIQDNGKFDDDFRINPVGRIMRKLWIDEFPMFINIAKRQMKLVGVRPLSSHYFSLYPEDMQKRRTQYKPGLFPPYYVDLPESFEEIIESERKYLDRYEEHPVMTDVKYFFIILYNIIVKRARSN